MKELPGFLLAAFALIASPGPATMSLAAVGAAFGPRNGIAYLLGLLTGLLMVVAVTATGVTAAVLAIPGVAPVLTAAAAGYMCYLAYRIAGAPPLTERSGGGKRPSFAEGVFLSLVNPKAYAAMVALFSGFVLVENHVALDAGLKLGIVVAVILPVDAAWLMVGAAIARVFRNPLHNRVINVTFAVLLLGSVTVALL